MNDLKSSVAYSYALPVDLELLKKNKEMALEMLNELSVDDIFPKEISYSVLFPWMPAIILQAPQASVQILRDMRNANITQADFSRSAHNLRWREHELGNSIFNSIRHRDPNDVEGNRKVITDILIGIGIIGALAMLAAMTIALIFLKLGPIGLIASVVTLILGFIVLLASVAIMVVLSLVLSLIS